MYEGPGDEEDDDSSQSSEKLKEITEEAIEAQIAVQEERKSQAEEELEQLKNPEEKTPDSELF